MYTSAPGNYEFIPGISFLSFAVIAKPGFEIRRVVLSDGPAAADALPPVLAWLDTRGCAPASLCGMEFRRFDQRQMTREEFNDFNASYVGQLERAGILVDGKVPLARTNVVLRHGAPGDALHAFSYVVPSARPPGETNFILSAVPEVRFRLEGGRVQEDVVEAGNASSDAAARKLAFIIDSCAERLARMQLSWGQASQIQLYMEADLSRELQLDLARRMNPALRRGLHCFHALPPIGPAVMEMDVRNIACDQYLERL